MRPARILFGLAAISCLTISWVPAQTSTSFQLEESTFNAGGRPDQNGIAVSASFRISLDSLGDPFALETMTSASFHAESGWLPAYPPPGEVSELVFSDKITLAWNPEPTAGAYNLYRDQVSNLSLLGFGNCEQQDIGSATTTDTDAISSGDGFFYLVAVENRLAEEGTKGNQSSGTERIGSVCP